MTSLFSIPFSPQVSFTSFCMTQQIIRPQVGPFLQVAPCQRLNRFYIFQVDYICFTHRYKYDTSELRNSSPLLLLSSSCPLSNESKENSSGENGMQILASEAPFKHVRYLPSTIAAIQWTNTRNNPPSVQMWSFLACNCSWSGLVFGVSWLNRQHKVSVPKSLYHELVLQHSCPGHSAKTLGMSTPCYHKT